MSECTNPKCRVILSDGRKICPECGTPVQMNETRTRRTEDLETMIRGDLNRKIPAGGNLPKSPGGGNGPLTLKQMLTVLIVSAVVFCVGFIPPAEEKLIESITIQGSSVIEMVEEDSQTVRFEITPGGFDADDVEVSLSDSDVVEVEKMTMNHGEDSCDLNVELKALTPGTTALKVIAEDGEVESDPVTITVSKKIEVQSISAFNPSSVKLKTGESYSAALTLKTEGLTPEHLKIESSDPNILRIDSAEMGDQDDASVLTLNLTGVAAGSAKLKVSSAADESISRTLSVTVSDPEPETAAQTSSAAGGGSASTATGTGSELTAEPSEDMSMTVYVTSSGKCYHYSSECSNMKHPKTTTQSQAIANGYEPCSKCVH